MPSDIKSSGGNPTSWVDTNGDNALSETQSRNIVLHLPSPMPGPKVVRRHKTVTPIEKIREPITQCTRCGERFYASWREDLHCPKCGRRPRHVPIWEGALCGLLPPIALISALLHKNDSPRSSLLALLLGMGGTMLHTALYFLLRY